MFKIVLPVIGCHSTRDTGATGPESPNGGDRVSLVDTLIHHLGPVAAQRLIVVARRVDLHVPLLATPQGSAAGCTTIGVDDTPHGTIGALLGARHLLDGDEALVVAPRDRWIDVDAAACVARMHEASGDGLILTMPSKDPGATVVRRDARDWVTRVVQPHGPSDEAVFGVCVFRRGRDFVRAAEAQLADASQAMPLSSVTSVYEALIEEGARIAAWPLNPETIATYDLRHQPDLDRLRAATHARRAIAA